MTLSDTLSRYTRLVNGALDSAFAGRGLPPRLEASMRYSLDAGGKRLRPALCLAAAELVGGDAAPALDAACAMELIHTYSLIHDDLPAMDNDDFRRGKPSNHRAFGEANAILAGDALLTLAFAVLARVPSEPARLAVAKGALDMAAGQSLDVNGEAADDAALAALQRKKTGALIRAAVLAGAHTAGASGDEVESLAAFSDAFGLLFQITDDILDAEGDASTLGKSVGKDAKDGKVTFVTMLGLPAARERAKRAEEAALLALEPFGTRAAFLSELTRRMRSRRA